VWANPEGHRLWRQNVARVSSGAVPLLITLDRKSEVPLIRQVYVAIREAIVSGALRAGAQVPSTRTLARELGVSRTTVVVAYDHLIAEGYIEPVSGAGSFVTSALRDAAGRSELQSSGVSDVRTSRAARTYVAARRLTLEGGATARAFRIGEPDVREFPSALWARLLNRAWKRHAPDALRYGPAGGSMRLRQEIAQYLAATRGVKSSAEQVILVRGAQQGLDLCARLLLDPGDSAWVEDPGYVIGRQVLRGVGAQIVPVPTDAEGLLVTEGKSSAENARVAYVAPSNQFPLGSTMSLRRRVELLGWAASIGAWIIEDDYDSEFRYAGQPLTALQGLDSAGRVLYIGTFSKTLFPALRLGYVVVPPQLVEVFSAARSTIDHAASSVEQLALAEFLASGQFARHVRQMRTLYRNRHDALVEAARELGDLLRIEPARTGMHVVGWLPAGVSDQQVAAAALEAGLETLPLSAHCVTRELPPGLVLGFAAVDETAVRTAVPKLARVIERVARRNWEPAVSVA
jgi:GntR family transcriptional regulator/MocR family aminotransferase